MTNREIAKILSETAKLMELHGVNEFKVKSLSNAAFAISRLESPLSGSTVEQIEQIRGIGKSTSLKVAAILESGSLPEYENYLQETPEGVVQIMRIKGIGAKKTALLWKELGIENPGELLYACNENRLVELKGFGSKTQEQIQKAIEYSISNRGLYHYAALDKPALSLVAALQDTGWFVRVSLTGDIRRKCELLKSIEIIASSNDPAKAYDLLKSKFPVSEVKEELLLGITAEGIPFTIECCPTEEFWFRLFITSSGTGHLEKLGSVPASGNDVTEEAIYDRLGLPFIEPELREGTWEVEAARMRKLPVLVKLEDLRGCLHNHSTWSDGLHSLRDMAIACRDMGLEYLGICDHSKSAFYANGLQAPRVALQHQEIERLNKELSPFRIFKGIESDILPDGSLDYTDDVLSTFDFIVASVHSGLKMTEEKATERLLRAIANPYTTILGHPTGRLLLARPGYPIDHKKVIDACAEHGVVIELNAHPYRLDLDWRWIQYALSRNVRISINPDAHHTGGIGDMYYGVCVARKGGLTKDMTFNSLSGDEISEYFRQRKDSVNQKILI